MKLHSSKVVQEPKPKKRKSKPGIKEAVEEIEAPVAPIVQEEVAPIVKEEVAPIVKEEVAPIVKEEIKELETQPIASIEPKKKRPKTDLNEIVEYRKVLSGFTLEMKNLLKDVVQKSKPVPNNTPKKPVPHKREIEEDLLFRQIFG